MRGYLQFFRILMMCCLLFAGKLMAGIEPYSKSLYGPFSLPKQLDNADPLFLNNGTWGSYQFRNVSDEVVLRVNDKVRITSNFSYKINVTVDCFKNPASASADSSFTRDLTVTYDVNQGVTYKGIAAVAFNGFYRLKVTINSQGVASSGDALPPANGVILRNTVTVDRIYPFSLTAQSKFAAVSLTANSRKLALNWDVISGAEEYDVEWTTLSAGDVNQSIATAMIAGSAGADSQADQLFRNNATRVTTAGQSHVVTLISNDDYLAARIRGVQYTKEGIRQTGAWSYRQGTSAYAAWNITAGWHSSDLNWQYSAAFAEEGKKKEVISYFDGTLRDRQTVTINNSDNVAVVAEKVYDLFGRPVATVLPAPVASGPSPVLHYFPGLNRNINGAVYSYLDINDPSAAGCEFLPGALSADSGASKYYSPGSAFKLSRPFQVYTPDAQGYPLAVTQYTPDNTGRTRLQGGVGPAFQPGTGLKSRTTKYFYGKPEQWELDQIFGSDVGYAEHYIKNTVIDPNYQISVSYLNASGKTIATALTGAAPEGMDSLASKTPQKWQTSTLLKPDQFSFDGGTLKLTASTTYTATVTGKDTIRFNLPQLVYAFSQAGQLCGKCYYDLNVKVTDPCSPGVPLANQNYPVGVKSNIATGCTPEAAYTNTIGLNFATVGEYNITFEFALNRQDVEAYTDTLFNRGQRAGVLSSKWSFVRARLGALDFSGMFSDCKTARAQLGTFAAFRAMYGTKVTAMGIDTAKLSAAELSDYQNVVQNTYNLIDARVSALNCDISPCEEIRQQMLKDVSPGGQYALFDTAGVALEPALNVIAVNWRTVFPVMSNPDTLSSCSPYTGVGNPPPCKIVVLENGSKISVNDAAFTLKMLVKYWKDEWAGLFISYHPEKCKLDFCELNIVSEKWDQKVAGVGKATDIGTIQPGLSYNYTNAAWLLAGDPFFKSGGLGYAQAGNMQADLNSYSVNVLGLTSASVKSLTGFVDFNLYQGEGQWDNSAPVSCRVPDRDWIRYRDLYLDLKKNYLKIVRNAGTCAGKCPVGMSPAPRTTLPADFIRSFVVENISAADIPTAQATGTCTDTAKKFMTIRCLTGPVTRKVYGYVGFSEFGLTTLPRFEIPAGSDRTFICTPKYSLPAAYYILGVDTTATTPSYIPLSQNVTPPPIQDAEQGTGGTGGYGGTTDFFIYDESALQGALGEVFWIRMRPGLKVCPGTTLYGRFTFWKDYGGGTQTFDKVFVLDPVNGTRLKVTDGVDNRLGWTSRIQGVVPTCSTPTTPPVVPGCSLAYQSKISRFDPENYAGMPLDTAAAYAKAKLKLDTVIRANCEANAERWMAMLAPGLAGKPQATIDNLRNALITYCAANGDKDHIYGSSTAKPNVSNTYTDFAAIIKSIALSNGAFTPTLNPWLLEGAETYAKPVTGAVPTTIYNSSAEIAGKLATEEAGTSNTGTAAKFAYLQGKYGSAMTLTQAELGMLESASASCNWVLPQGITLPYFLLPGNGACLDWTAYSSAKTAMLGEIPGLTSASTNYDLILTNYMNQKFGFSLSYSAYLAYEASHTGLLCNQSVSFEVPVSPYAEIQSRIEAAASDGLSLYAAYVTDQKNLIRSGYISTCSGAQPTVTNKALATIYHFTLYYYDQADNLVRTVPPEGVKLLTDAQIAQVQQLRSGDAAVCGTPYTGPTANADVNTAFSNLGTRIASGANTAVELWLYNTGSSGNQLAKTTQDGKYLFQVSILNNTIGVDIFSNPSSGQFNNANRVTVSLSGLPALQAWTHLVVQSTDLQKGKLSVYINGFKAAVVNNALPAVYPDKLTTLKHMRIYNHLLYPAEILNNAGNDCFMPLNTDAYWARFNVPAAGSETTVGGSSTQETRITGIYPEHTLVTDYQYNATNQVVLQNSPDGGTNRFWYDQLSRLLVSQNDKQLATTDYSYTKYDDLGRITEVGQKKNAAAGLPAPGYVTDLTAFNSATANVQITSTFYDDQKNLTGISGLTILKKDNKPLQRNLRKRVVASVYRATQTGAVQNATYYDYDLDGNVANLYQQIGTLGVKQIGYEYDLISGKVNFVRYQEGQKDQYYYKYIYDAENRLTDAYSGPKAMLRSFGTSDLFKETKIADAHYDYYLHGPLARLELGSDSGRVQGIDYAYTLQGWMKGINNQDLNAAGPAGDIGADGAAGDHISVAKDAMGFALGYYGGDYAAIGQAGAMAFGAGYVPSAGEYTGQNLYNGNISSSTLAVRQANLGGGAMTGYTYHYDQLNRLKTTRQHPGISGSWDKTSITQLFGETYTYDGNGNILTLNRHGSAATAPTIDSLTYNYSRDGNGRLTNNRLNYITDRIASSNYAGDLVTQASTNYAYDAIGNMTKATSEKLTGITWSVYGKILTVSKASGNLTYTYDPSGNRVSKLLAGTNVTTWYVRDAQGNTLAVYDNAGGTTNWKEQHLYGSSRIGMWTPQISVATGSSTDPVNESGVVGKRFYELSNHLGNVIATVSDKRLQTGTGLPVTYLPDVISAQDYYSFGMVQPARQYTATNASKYRYGFNGKENDNEVKLDASGNEIAGAQQDYGMRIYDPRVGKFLSLDPISAQYPELTPYQFASDSPIENVDLDGLESLKYGKNVSPNMLDVINEGDAAYPLKQAANGLGNLWRKAVANAKGENTYRRTTLVYDKSEYGITFYQESSNEQTGKGWSGIKESTEDVLDLSNILGGYKNSAGLFNKAPGEYQALKEAIHHIFTNKNYKRGEQWSKKFEPLFQEAGYKLNDAINKVKVLGHRGPHPDEYHKEIYNRLIDAVEGLKGEKYLKAFEATLNQLSEEVSKQGTRLNKLITGG
ncbi:hypothetical protein D0C36_15795 [Mucilaginibacter conchicola]|uniref:RHS repeat-associated core domain-containing protein n=1 Tax=Mucilaginibacter conchicola TaxID=2303333 RepID=A0A372NU94_9SPHI|nr:AHH domain-containing protein [Mucilaginibacter conchicola]RFZ92853.1 hypothetical protein D0C36_15795 [Mucilaginibacter conchicola]